MKKYVVAFREETVLEKLTEMGVVRYYPGMQENAEKKIVFIQNADLEKILDVDGVLYIRKARVARLIG